MGPSKYTAVMLSMKRLLLILLLLLGIAVAVGYYLYNKAPDSTQQMPAVESLRAEELFSRYESDENTANADFLDKVIVVQGAIQAVNQDTSGISLTLQSNSGMFGVVCRMEDKMADPNAFTVHQEIRLKGVCTGYLMDVVLVRCVQVTEDND
jgi:hypothetical protein